MRAIIEGGERCVTELSWFRVMHLYMVFAPEVMDWCYCVLHVTKRGSDDLSKRILDAVGAKE
ncbi:hypothetical protein QJS10_CPB04g01246 [Acorus calamus]|uniref:Uncharacterized protein n=1 Tax=Acorus calamus TaxID=4465 RepID=A0AAV9EZ64_ACOCL|nr:hypothetical protein QJS10_CPB04g01246 [Acorus calamus]